jgi:hypothetical protein
MEQSSSKLLTAQFYEWEKRGRGYAVYDTPVRLEPYFVPFFGHFIDQPYIDDGKQHTLMSKVKRFFVPDHTVTIPEIAKDIPVAYPDDEIEPALSLFSLTLPKGYQAKTDTMEHCVVMLSKCGTPVSFELVASANDIQIAVVCREAAASFVYTQLATYFPECSVRETQTDAVLEIILAMQPAYTVDFGLAEEFMRPLAAPTNAAHDPYTPLFGVFDRLCDDEHIVLQVLFSGTRFSWGESINTAVSDGRGSSFFFDALEMPALAKEKISRPLMAATVRIACFAETLNDAGELLQHSALALIHASTSAYNRLVPLGDAEYGVEDRLIDIMWRQTRRVGMLINSRELANLAHVPSATLSKKLVKNTRNTKQAPAYLHDEAYILGINEHQGHSVEVGISTEQRLKHLHIIGATGTGKSTLLQSLVYQDIISNIGCCVLDPHGDLIDSILKIIPEDRIADVVLIDPSDSLHPVGFNILCAQTELERELLASDLVALFKRFSTSWGDQLHSVLANAIMAFLYNTKIGHLGDLRKFLIEPAFRNTILGSCTDPDLIYYWHKEYPLLKTSSIGSILTRLDSFLRPKAIRHMLCQPQSLDMSALMDGNKIVLVKLSQGLIGEENSYLLGAFIVAKLQQAAMARQQQAAATRTPFFCYMDEFQHFITPSLQTMLSGARKYGLGLVCVHQDMQQVQGDIAAALMSNVGTRVCFRVSDTDAKRLQEGFSGFCAEDLQNLGIGEAIARVNTANADFNLAVVPLEYDGEDNSDDIIATSRNLYSVPIQQSIVPLEPVLLKAPAMQENPPPAKPIANAEPAPSVDTVREHRYLQTFVKTLAEQHGYKANIEVPTKDGKGHIDVLLEKGDETIAVEISVSTADWELHNMQKCLAEQHSKIVACATNTKKLEQLRQKMDATLTLDEVSRIVLVTPDQLPSLFARVQQPGETVTTMKGYRVKVRHDESKPQSSTEDIIKRIIGNGKQP